jgi:hypothetical protein
MAPDDKATPDPVEAVRDRLRALCGLAGDFGSIALDLGMICAARGISSEAAEPLGLLFNKRWTDGLIAGRSVAALRGHHFRHKLARELVEALDELEAAVNAKGSSAK